MQIPSKLHTSFTQPPPQTLNDAVFTSSLSSLAYAPFHSSHPAPHTQGLAWMANGSTRSVFNLSFAKDNNIADITAKSTSQWIFASLFGTAAGGSGKKNEK